MTDPKEGYNSGVNRNVTGTIDSSGTFDPGVSTTGFVPSSYDGITGTLTAAGDGYPLASGAKNLSIGIQTASAGPILIAFGTSEVDAEANVVGTVGSEVGMLLGAGAEGDVYPVGVPQSTDITHYAIAENHGTPTGVVLVTQGV